MPQTTFPFTDNDFRGWGVFKNANQYVMPTYTLPDDSCGFTGAAVLKLEAYNVIVNDLWYFDIGLNDDWMRGYVYPGPTAL